MLGLCIGLGAGVALAYNARVALTPTLSLLFSMAIAATVLALVRRPMWRHENAVETLLRIVLGFMLGALLDLGAHRFLDHALPFAIPPLGAGLHWLEHPMLVGAFVGTLLGLLVSVEPAPAKPETPKDTGKSERSAMTPAKGAAPLADSGASGTPREP